MLLLSVKGATVLAPLLWGGSTLYGPVEVACLVPGLSSALAAGYPPRGPPEAGGPDGGTYPEPLPPGLPSAWPP